MRLLVLTAAYPAPSDPVRAVYVENLNRAMHRPPDYEVAVVAPRVSAADPKEEMRRGIRVRRFRYAAKRRLKELRRPSPLVVGTYLISALAATISECRRLRPDVLLCHWVLPCGPPAAVAARKAGIPLVLVAHGSDIHRYALASRIAGTLARLAVRSADFVVAVSAELRRLLVARFAADPARTATVPMGIDGEVFSLETRGETEAKAEKDKIRAKIGLEPARPVLLYVGDLLEEKGLWELLEAHSALLERGIRADLYCAGDGPLRSALERSRPGREGRIRCLGRLSQVELAEWYRAADLLVLPSWSEGCPVSVQEALACGLPVVAASVGGVPELVADGVTGRLVPPRNAPELARAIAECLEPGRLEAFRAGILASGRDDSVKARVAEFRRILDEVTR